MTPQLQLFMVLGALVLLCIIFTLLKRGHCGGVPLRNLRIAGRFVH